MASRRKSKQVRVLSTYELIAWFSPEYIEMKAGSTDQAGAELWVRALLDGRYVWGTSFTRERFPDGRRADWKLGTAAMGAVKPRQGFEVTDTFEQALTLARAELDIVPIPVWRN